MFPTLRVVFVAKPVSYLHVLVTCGVFAFRIIQGFAWAKPSVILQPGLLNTTAQQASFGAPESASVLVKWTCT